MKYFNQERTVIEDGNKTVPTDPDNVDYQDILRRVAAGEVIDPFVAPVPSAEQLLAEAKVKAVRVIEDLKFEDDIKDPRYNSLPEVIDYRSRRP